jgi:ligand-binding SRPBCC domain-containing protein
LPVIHLETCISAPIERSFDLARSVEAHCASVARTRERAVAGVTTGLLRLGDTVTWEAFHFGVRRRLTVVISVYERPYRFVDEMTSGPFRSLRHSHEFTRAGSGTRMVDDFRYEAPGGLLGIVADRMFLEAYLRRLLSGRNAALKRMAEAESE